MRFSNTMKDTVFAILCHKKIMHRGLRKKIINEIDIIVCAWGGGDVDLGKNGENEMCSVSAKLT